MGSKDMNFIGKQFIVRSNSGKRKGLLAFFLVIQLHK